MRKYKKPITKKVRQIDGTCNFCDTGEVAIEIIRDNPTGGLAARFCDRCVQALYKAWKDQL
jgi:hypothetical protein